MSLFDGDDTEFVCNKRYVEWRIDNLSAFIGDYPVGVVQFIQQKLRKAAEVNEGQMDCFEGWVWEDCDPLEQLQGAVDEDSQLWLFIRDIQHDILDLWRSA